MKKISLIFRVTFVGDGIQTKEVWSVHVERNISVFNRTIDFEYTLISSLTILPFKDIYGCRSVSGNSWTWQIFEVCRKIKTADGMVYIWTPTTELSESKVYHGMKYVIIADILLPDRYPKSWAKDLSACMSNFWRSMRNSSISNNFKPWINWPWSKFWRSTINGVA